MSQSPRAQQEAQLKQRLLDPLWVVRNLMRVKGFEAKPVDADWEKIDPHLKGEMAAFIDDPAEGEETIWPCILKYRQAARSSNVQTTMLAHGLYRPDLFCVTLADKDDRSDMLHKLMEYAYKHFKRPDLLTSRISNKEVNQLSLVNGTKFLGMTAGSEAAGIGTSPDVLHCSEVGYWPGDPHKLWSEMQPALAKRRLAHVVFECVASSQGDFWHDIYSMAKMGNGRFRAFFTPWYLGRMNVARWREDWGVPDLEEQRLLDIYGQYGLGLEHLAFRRNQLATVRLFVKDPAQWEKQYPINDVDCWVGTAKTGLDIRLLSRFKNDATVPWREPFVEYEPPQPGIMYVIGVDPSGVSARDHGAFQVWKALDGDFRQVACYAARVKPDIMGEELMHQAKRYNNALVVVERNGVGAGILNHIRGYPNLFHGTDGVPGWNNNPQSMESAMSFLMSLIRNSDRGFTFFDEALLAQLQTYKNDKLVELSIQTEVRGNHRGTARERHHWDKVSALMCVMAGLTECGPWPKLDREVRPINRDYVPIHKLKHGDLRHEDPRYAHLYQAPVSSGYVDPIAVSQALARKWDFH